MNRQVAINIYKAQVASDNAKGIKEVTYNGKIKANYDGKDEYIIRAINLILHKRNSGFSFYVTTDKELSETYKRKHYIVYFDFTVKGEWKQISFHSLNGELEKYLKKGKSHSVEWDRKSSRETCKFLKEIVGF